MTRRSKLLRTALAAGIAALLALPSVGSAQTRIPTLDEQDRRGEVGRYARQKAVERFDGTDADKDGRLSRDEVARFGYIADNFERMDADHDGFLNWEEFVGHDRWKKE